MARAHRLGHDPIVRPRCGGLSCRLLGRRGQRGRSCLRPPSKLSGWFDDRDCRRPCRGGGNPRARGLRACSPRGGRGSPPVTRRSRAEGIHSPGSARCEPASHEPHLGNGPLCPTVVSTSAVPPWRSCTGRRARGSCRGAAENRRPRREAPVGCARWQRRGAKSRYQLRQPCAGGGREDADSPSLSGGGGIRTHGTLARPTVFKTAPFDRSGTPPVSESRRRPRR